MWLNQEANQKVTNKSEELGSRRLYNLTDEEKSLDFILKVKGRKLLKSYKQMSNILFNLQ